VGFVVVAHPVAVAPAALLCAFLSRHLTRAANARRATPQSADTPAAARPGTRLGADEADSLLPLALVEALVAASPFAALLLAPEADEFDAPNSLDGSGSSVLLLPPGPHSGGSGGGEAAAATPVVGARSCCAAIGCDAPLAASANARGSRFARARARACVRACAPRRRRARARAPCHGAHVGA
jgi:hypothetical protein